MSLLDVQQRPAIVERINPSRYLISSPSIGNVPRSSRNLSSLPGNSGMLSGSSTAARIARKRSTQPTGYSWATYVPTTSPQSSQSASPVSTSALTSDLVKLGTIDLRSAIQSVNAPASPVQTTMKPRKTSPPSNAITPPAGTAPSLPLLSTPSNRPQSLPVFKSFGTRLQITVTPRPGPRLPIFHPDNTTALPEISRPALLFIPNGPSPPPARRTTRARKPAAKAMALSLGLASDGSGLDGIETASGEHNINNSGGKGEKDRASVTSDLTPAPAPPPRSHKKKVVHREEEPAGPEGGVSEGSAPKTSRRPPKRKAAAQAAEVMIVDFTQGIDHDDGGRLDVPPAKRPRRGGPDQHTATTHAPSPLSNELARAEASPPPTLPPPTTSMTSASNAKKRKAETPGSESADADASVASPPPAVRPKTAASSGRSRSGSGSKATQAKSKPSKRSDDSSKSSVRAESTSTNGDSGSEDKQAELERSDAKNASEKEKDKDAMEEGDDEDDDDDDEPPRKSYNMFEEPLDLKPRPRPTYKAHLKRLSTGSLGEDRPSRPRASKSKKSSSSGSSRSHSRKESEDAQQQQVLSITTTASPEAEIRSPLPPVTPTSAGFHTTMKSDAMELDAPVPNVPQAGSAIGVSIAV
ncbi:hypothetical protein FS837_008449 [Tulasnella sp. UAMH 9824]|nr:hypothetical protein FS837_008449 [Tulasnella sp. UAMH 9824]